MPTDTLTADVAEMRRLLSMISSGEEDLYWWIRFRANLAPRLADALDAMRQENERLRKAVDRFTSTLVKCLTCDGEGGWIDDGEPSICDDCGGLGYTTIDAGGRDDGRTNAG